MRGMLKRLSDLESLRGAPVNGQIDLDALTDDELDRLEGIAAKHESGLLIENMSSVDLCFIASLPVIA